MNDRAEIVKIEEHSNSAGDLLPHGRNCFHAEAVEHYYHKCVLKESAPDFLQFLDAENLMRELRTGPRPAAATRVCRTPSGTSISRRAPIGCSRPETSFQILLDFRSVDEIVREEREHQHALERGKASGEPRDYGVISAISKIYYTICDLRTGHYEEVANERQMHRYDRAQRQSERPHGEMSKQSIVAGVSALC